MGAGTGIKQCLLFWLNRPQCLMLNGVPLNPEPLNPKPKTLSGPSDGTTWQLLLRVDAFFKVMYEINV